MAASLEADAGLVEDLRSGKSDVKTAQSSTAIAAFRVVREQKSAPDYKAVVITRNIYGKIWSWQRDASAVKAIENALKHCKEKENQSCDVFAVGDTIVQGHSQAELADAIEAYQLEVSGSKAASKSTTSAGKTVYCINNSTDYIYQFFSNKCPIGEDEITKSEYHRLNKNKYDRAKNKRIDTASEAKAEIVYCKAPSGNVYQATTKQCSRYQNITKAEYDRLKNKKTDTASSTEPDAASSVDDPLEAKLEKLKKLLEKGLITEEEAAAKRAKLLEDL